MHVLLTSFILQARSGAELYLSDLALGLKERGFSVSAFSPRLGDLAQSLNEQGIETVSRVDALTTAPDIIHGHHNIATLTALNYFKSAKGLFLCHDGTSWHDRSPLHPRLLRYFAVDLFCQRRVAADTGFEIDAVGVVGNSVNLKQFRRTKKRYAFSKDRYRSKPKTALVFSNYAAEHNYLPIVRQACQKMQLDFEVRGASSGQVLERPEDELGKYDIVFAKARCAMEGMVAGAAVILCDYAGLGEMVTPGCFDEMRSWNFGRQCLTQPVETDRVIAQIERFDLADVMAVASMARQQLDLAKVIDQWVEIYRQMEAIDLPALQQEKEDLAMANFLNQLSQTLYGIYALEYEVAHLQHLAYGLPAPSGHPAITNVE